VSASNFRPNFHQHFAAKMDQLELRDYLAAEILILDRDHRVRGERMGT
jgi:hypothetical protein